MRLIKNDFGGFFARQPLPDFYFAGNQPYLSPDSDVGAIWFIEALKFA